MKNINLNNFAPIISDKEIGDEIYMLIKKALDREGRVEVDLAEIKSMATFCAKQIFGRLYLELGATFFFEKVIIKNADDDLKTIIRIGIQNAIEDKSQE